MFADKAKAYPCIHNTSFSSKLMNEPLKLECYITVGYKMLARDKHSSLLGSFWSYEEN